MGEVKFGVNETPVSEAVPAAEPAKPAEPTPGAVATRRVLLGDRIPSLNDIILPRVNISQNIGPLSDQYPSGALVFDSQGSGTQLFVPAVTDKTGKVIEAASPPVDITFLAFADRRWTEKTDGGARGVTVKNEEDVPRAGGTTSWDEWTAKKASGIKYFQILEDIMVAIQKPDSIADENHTVFTFEVEGKWYAIGMWAQKGAVFTECAKRVLLTNRACGYLSKGGYPSYHFSVTTWEKPFNGGHAAWVPKCVPNGKSTPAFIDWVSQVLPGQG